MGSRNAEGDDAVIDIAKLAYLTSPGPNVFILNFQVDHEGGGAFVFQFEISRAHLANIIIDGASFSLRETSFHRVQVSSQTESANHERSTSAGT